MAREQQRRRRSSGSSNSAADGAAPRSARALYRDAAAQAAAPVEAETQTFLLPDGDGVNHTVDSATSPGLPPPSYQQLRQRPPVGGNSLPMQSSDGTVARYPAASAGISAGASMGEDTLNISQTALAAIDEIQGGLDMPDPVASPRLFELKTLHLLEHQKQAEKVEKEVRNLVDLGLLHQDEELVLHLAETEGRGEAVLDRIESNRNPELIDTVVTYTALAQQQPSLRSVTPNTSSLSAIQGRQRGGAAPRSHPERDWFSADRDAGRHTPEDLAEFHEVSNSLQRSLSQRGSAHSTDRLPAAEQLHSSPEMRPPAAEVEPRSTQGPVPLILSEDDDDDDGPLTSTAAPRSGVSWS